MKRLCVIAGMVWFLAVSGHAIGLQHGLFRSQSTQGKAWTGTMTFVREAYNLTVYPDYLDVELEWELGVGGTEPDSFKNALEITGNINFENGSVVVGMVLWNGDKLLKAKLKTNEQATQQYEEVVDRNSDVPPPPRDPVILKWIRDDNYDISIFPVSWGKTRTLRIRYLVPAYNINGVNKMGYPHAFSPIATVSIKNGPGIDGYKIESGASSKTFTDAGAVALSSSDYSFQSYSSTGKQSPKFIIPMTSGYSEGSRFFMKGFRTENFKGQMIHFVGMPAADIIKKVLIKEDYVILWRWNHPDILKKYACQIIAQSNLIKVFLATLEAQNKRAALIVDVQGGERKVFKLDAKGGAAYRQMMDFLSGLSAMNDQKPPKGAPPAFTQPEIDSIVKASFNEFQAALKMALSLFDDSSACRHLLLLTAGPRWTSKLAASQTLEWDETVDIASLSSYLAGSSVQYNVSDAAQPLHWPGVNLDAFVIKPRPANLKIYVSLTNNKDTNRILVPNSPVNQGYSYSYNSQHGGEMRIYTARPIKEQVLWSFYINDKLLTEYRETPFIVEMRDGMQYARLIGSAPELVPMAEYMPSSLASTLGFIDQKYALLALEQDTLSRRLTERYRYGGVPTLNREDIFPAADEKARVPVAEWLNARQPVNTWAPVPGIRLAQPLALANPAAAAGAPIMLEVAMFDAVDMTFKYVNPQPLLDSVPREASSAVSGSGLKPFSFEKGIRVFTADKRIVIALGETLLKNRDHIKIALFDLRGKMVKQWKHTDISSEGRISWSPRENGLCYGIFIVRISTGFETISRQIIVR